MKGWDFKSLIVETFHADPERVSTKIDIEFHVPHDRPINKSFSMSPKDILEGV